MRVFKPQLSDSGVFEWTSVDSQHFDWAQEIAASNYGDMLCDADRNLKYMKAIEKVIRKRRANGQSTDKVLDIGTGTGLLSLMAAREGAKSVFALEEFQPMAACAERIIEQNGFSENITVINSRSTLNDHPLHGLSDILVTEVFDTELIGEGAIETFNHAHESLLSKDSTVIPHSAMIYALPVDSEFLWRWNSASHQHLSGFEDSQCAGVPALHDIQTSRLKPGRDFISIVKEPVPLMEFNFSKKLLLSEAKSVKLSAERTGQVHALIVWWCLFMDEEKDFVIDMAPSWFFNKREVPYQWREHWMQAIYYLPKPVVISEGDLFTISISRDEFSFWFSINDIAPVSRPHCTCKLHETCSRQRIAALSDDNRNSSYWEALKSLNLSGKNVIVASDCGWLPATAAKLGASNVVAIESNFRNVQFTKHICHRNGLSDIVHIIKTVDDISHIKTMYNIDSFDAIISEPFFSSTSLQPWNGLHLKSLCTSISQMIGELPVIMPCRAVLKCCVVELVDLQKLRNPIEETICGFNLSQFNDLTQGAMNHVYNAVEPHSMWEYESFPRSTIYDLAHFNFQGLNNFTERFHNNEVTFSGAANAVILWMDYNLVEDTWVSNGPIGELIPTQVISWCHLSKQGVYLLPSANKSKPIHSLFITVDTRPINDILSISCEFSYE